MASLLSARRTNPKIRLKATVPTESEPEVSEPTPSHPSASWLLFAVGGAVVVAASGWVIVAGLAVVGWLAAEPGTLISALKIGTQLWLLANGAGAIIGGAELTLVPLGVSLLLAFMISRAATMAARHAAGEPWPVVARVSAAITGCYVLIVAAVSVLFGTGEQTVRGVVGALLISGIAALWGSSRGIDGELTMSWPVWSRAIPQAVAGAQAVMVLAGSAALATSLILHFDRIKTLTTALDAGIGGGIALVAIQLAFVPNAVLWAASYTLGAGFTAGGGSVVAPRGTDLGMLPSIPLLGAMPAEGAGGSSQLFWLAGGVLAGGLAAFLVMRARPTARFDETSLVGGLAGAIAGLVFTGLAWFSRGGLGTGRLAELGPRLGELVVMSVTLMGISGLIVGLAWGLLRRSR